MMPRWSFYLLALVMIVVNVAASLDNLYLHQSFTGGDFLNALAVVVILVIVVFYYIQCVKLDKHLITLALLKKPDQTASEVSESASVSISSAYTNLIALENDGLVTSHWEEMSKPRRRRYRVI